MCTHGIIWIIQIIHRPACRQAGYFVHTTRISNICMCVNTLEYFGEAE